jgi:hypothetical protein
MASRAHRGGGPLSFTPTPTLPTVACSRICLLDAQIGYVGAATARVITGTAVVAAAITTLAITAHNVHFFAVVECTGYLRSKC